MSAFWTDAQGIFETARQAFGSADCDWAILVGPQGEVHILEGSGWSLPGLLAHHGARAAYHVTRAGGRVCLEGRQGLESCLLRSESPADVARRLMPTNIPLEVCAAGSLRAALPPPPGQICTTFA